MPSSARGYTRARTPFSGSPSSGGAGQTTITFHRLISFVRCDKRKGGIDGDN
jgi:hypothetical protein